jgi:hypothetical protein
MSASEMIDMKMMLTSLRTVAPAKKNANQLFSDQVLYYIFKF